MQSVVVPKESGISGSIFAWIRHGAFPQFAGIFICSFRPLGFEEALEEECCPSPLGERSVDRNFPPGRLACERNAVTSP